MTIEQNGGTFCLTQNTSDHASAIRSELLQTIAQTWHHIASPGTWFDSHQRLAIAAESRQATTCDFCQQRLNALSPTAVDGQHHSNSDLAPALIDLVHRIRTDHTRISASWLRTSIIDEAVTDTEYVEIVSLVALVTALDTFTAVLDLPSEELPPPQPGEPSRQRPECAHSDIAWIPTIAPEDASGSEADIYAGQTGAHIHRALSLVPAEKHAFFTLDNVMYLPDHQLRQYDQEFRAIDHRQIELLAARASAINQCHY